MLKIIVIVFLLLMIIALVLITIKLWFPSLFETKKVPKPKLIKKSVNVGVTTVKVTFIDGREFYTKIYGSVYGTVRPNVVYGSLEAAQESIRTYSNYGNLDKVKVTIVNDVHNPTISMIGEPIEFEIKDTADFFQDIEVEDNGNT